MKRPGVTGLVAVATIISLVGAALAQSGHFLQGGRQAPLCVDLGTVVACSGKVAGLGGTTFEITVQAPATAIIECENPGGNVAPGQDTQITAAGTSGPLPTPRNGHFRFAIMTVPLVVPNTPTCPNPGWTAHVVDVVFGDATLRLLEDGVLVDEITVPVTVP
jgi:hypothetical protein